jgi:hypothetical protein
MTPKKQIIQTIIATITAVILLSACGGGSSKPPSSTNTTNNNTGTNPAASTGLGTGTIKGTAQGIMVQKIDGLFYVTSSSTAVNTYGYTSNGGQFTYNPGDLIYFYLPMNNAGKNAQNDNTMPILFGTAASSMDITSNMYTYTIDSQSVAVNTAIANNIISFLKGLDIDGNNANGITLNSDEANRVDQTVRIDFTMPTPRFIRQYASYAKYIAGATGATGNIGQTDATFNITLSKGVALFFPSDLMNIDPTIVTPSGSATSTSVIEAFTFMSGNGSTTYDGIYVVGLSPGTQKLEIKQGSNTMDYTITVVDPSVFPDFTGTTVSFPNTSSPAKTDNVDYQNYLKSITNIDLTTSNVKMIFQPGEI